MIAAASALALMTAVAATGDSPLRLGIDASDLSPSFLLTRPQVDPALLAYAPTSPDVAFAASLVTVGTGVFLTGAGVALLLAGPLSPKFPGAVLLGTGILMVNFGAFVGDLLNGDVRRFVIGGLLKIAGSLVLTLLGPVGPFAWAAWVAMDVWGARDAPARWVGRNYPAPAETPAARPTGGLFSFAF